jgi:nicotinamidase-related amidase
MAEQQDIDPRRTAIVAIDFQHDIVGADGPFADLFHAEVKRTNLIPAATRLLGEARAAGVKIVYSTGTFQPGYPELVPNIPLLSQVAQYGCLVNGTGRTSQCRPRLPDRGGLRCLLDHIRDCP